MSEKRSKYDGAGELTVALDRFEQAWQDESPPEITDFLQQSESAADRREALIALVMVDLECRWRRADQDTSVAATTPLASDILPVTPRLEDYVSKYTDLGSVSDLPIDLNTQTSARSVICRST